MKETGRVIYLQTSFEVLWKRVQAKTHRPLLKTDNPQKALSDLLSKRKSLYEKTCDGFVVTDGKTADQVASEIFVFLENHP